MQTIVIILITVFSLLLIIAGWNNHGKTDLKTKIMQRYLIDWFNPENHWSSCYIAVIDRAKSLVMFDGETWQDIEEDHL